VQRRTATLGHTRPLRNQNSDAMWQFTQFEIFTLILRTCVAVSPVESVTYTVKKVNNVDCASPLISPVVEFMLVSNGGAP